MIAGCDIDSLLWRELCKLAGYVGESIIDEVSAGFDIVGTGPTLPAFPSQLVPATSSVQDLERHATLAQASLQTTVKSSGGAPFYKQAEVARSPGTASWSPNRRFGLRQGGIKIRRIEDLSGEEVYVRCTTSNKLNLKRSRRSGPSTRSSPTASPRTGRSPSSCPPRRSSRTICTTPGPGRRRIAVPCARKAEMKRAVPSYPTQSNPGRLQARTPSTEQQARYGGSVPPCWNWGGRPTWTTTPR
jgi:hypothetical protein